MWQLFLDRLSADPSWIIGSGILMVMMIVLIVFSFFRNVRQLAWFSMAGVITAGVYLLSVNGFPLILEWLANYRADLTFMVLLQTTDISTLFIEFLIYFSLYSFLAISLIAALGLWSLLTFRWQRWRIIFRRSISESWMVILFSVLAVVINMILLSILGNVHLEQVTNVFQLMSFIFCLQFFLRLIDTAYLSSPRVFMEFTYATGLWMILFKFFSDWWVVLQPSSLDGMVRELFLNQLFTFFLGVMIIGYLAHFFVRALFASVFVLEIDEQRSWKLFVLTSRLLLSGREATYAQRKILIGVIFSLFMGFAFLLLSFQGWTLALIPAFFLGYFILFYFLDRQDDARIRGDIVEKRM